VTVAPTEPTDEPTGEPTDDLTPIRPPSVDRLARSLAASGLPHPILVDLARTAIASGTWHDAAAHAEAFRRTLLTPVVNATGVLLHTNLGRAPLAHHQDARPTTVEFDLATGERGSRQRSVGQLLATLCGAEAAMIVNNNAAAVLLVVAALAAGRDVVVSRGESVEIGGSFRVPEVMEQSGARLVDVGTTNRTRVADYRRAIERTDTDVALLLKVHPSNYRVEGFVEDTPVEHLATLGVPVVADIGSGLIDATCPWLPGAPPAWLAGEPAAVQSLAAGAALVTFSTDKLLGGPQGGVIAGRADLVAACQRHPLARALRPGGLVMNALQHTALAYLHRRVVDDVPFWAMVATPLDDLRTRAATIAAAAGPHVRVVATDALPGAGSAPGITMPSVGVDLAGDHLTALRAADPPVIARVASARTVLDLRTVHHSDDAHLATLLAALPVAIGEPRR
jgi:L-seryl-tRNA(Ser) seleniumtransferase